MIYAALKSGYSSTIVTNDHFGDHSFKVKGVGQLFKRWLQSVQIKYVTSVVGDNIWNLEVNLNIKIF